MPASDEGRRILTLDAAVFVAFILAIRLKSWWFFFLAGALILLIVRLQGGLRFPRLRRWASETSGGVLRLARGRRPSRAAVRNLAILGAVVFVLVVLDSLNLSAPGTPRGLSLETGGLNLGDANVNLPGAGLATVLSYVFIAAILVSFWLRLWKAVATSNDSRRKGAYFVCLGAFVLAFPLYLLRLRLVDFATPEENVRFAQDSLEVFLVLMSLSACLAIALPYLPMRRARSPTEQPPTIPQA